MRGVDGTAKERLVINCEKDVAERVKKLYGGDSWTNTLYIIEYEKLETDEKYKNLLMKKREDSVNEIARLEKENKETLEKLEKEFEEKVRLANLKPGSIININKPISTETIF